MQVHPSDRHAHAPRFPKAKDEGWWLVLGEVDSGELLALKRVGFIHGRPTARGPGKTKVSLGFPAPPYACRKIYSVYLVSDCYLGLDQQYELSVEVMEDQEGTGKDEASSREERKENEENEEASRSPCSSPEFSCSDD